MRPGQYAAIRPMIFELAIMFAAGYVVGHYSNINIPTAAEVANEMAKINAAKGTQLPVNNIPPVKRPIIEYDNGQIRFNIKGR